MKKRLFLAALIVILSGLPLTPAYANTSRQPDNDKLRERVEALINEERVRYGLSELIMNDTLKENAQLRAKELEVSFAHTRLDGSNFSSAIAIDYRSAGENVAYFCSSNLLTEEKLSEIFVEGWLGSKGHRENILKTSWDVTGIGVHVQGENIYMVQLFVQDL